MQQAASWFVGLLTAYLAVGGVFAVPFVWFGVNRIDRAASGGSWGFRMIILPGVVALWPILASRWIRGRTPPEERNAHRALARMGKS